MTMEQLVKKHPTPWKMEPGQFNDSSNIIDGNGDQVVYAFGMWATKKKRLLIRFAVAAVNAEFPPKPKRKKKA